MLKSPVASFNEFREALAVKCIDTQVSLKENGAPEAITFVDHEIQCVCRDNELGPYHSPAALQARIQYAAQSRQADVGTQHVAQEKAGTEHTVFANQRTAQKKHETPTSFRKEKEPAFSVNKKAEQQPASTSEKVINTKTEQGEEKMGQPWELQKKRHRKNHLHLSP